MTILNVVAEEILNIPRLYTSLAQYLSILIFLFFLPKRFNKTKTIVYSTIFFVMFILFHYWLSAWILSLWLVGMTLSVLLMYMFIIAISDINYFTAGYLTIIGFVVSEFAASIEWQIEYFLLTNSVFPNFEKLILYTPVSNIEFRMTFILLFVYSLIFVSLYFLEKRYKSRNEIYYIHKRDFISILVIAILVFSISNISFLNINTPITSSNPLEMFYIRTLVNFSGIIIIYFQREQKYLNQKDLEVYTMRKILDDQFEKYNLTKKSRDLINHKYHDIKNFIELLRAEVDFEQKHMYLDNLEKSVENITLDYYTGNDVLDTMLHTKTEMLNRHNIKLTSVINGELLDFMEIVDIVSVFGNLLDNAIESLKKVEDEDKRLLKLAVFKEKNFVIIRIENYYENKLKYDGSYFLTTKKNKTYHGYGLKSVESSISKYDGSISIDTERNWFQVIILIPI